MKKLLLASMFFALASWAGGQASAQTAIGLRLGYWNGVTFRTPMGGASLELIAQSRWRGWYVTALYEKFKAIPDAKGLRWFYGAGAHVGTYNGKYRDGWASGSYTNIGADIILGLDYTIPGAPINISLDWKPTVEFSGYGKDYGGRYWGADNGVLSVRFVF